VAVTASSRAATRAATCAGVEAFELYRFFHAGDSETLALRGVSLRVEAGEMVALLGASGSGKSTLLNCLAGLDEPDGGHVDLLGERLTRRPEAQRARRRAAHIGILMQAHNLIPTLRLSDNMALAMQLAGKPDRARAAGLFEQLGLAGHVSARPAQLSGGEVARAGLAVALATAPNVLLADEPTGEVDAATEALVLAVFDAQRAAGTAILIATHSEALAAHADRVVRMRDGRIVDV
jgi:putative ABC transport system ATP-binding protein